MWWGFYLIGMLLLLPLILGVWILPAWVSGLWLALILEVAVLSEVWLGWGKPKTYEENMMWWMAG